MERVFFAGDNDDGSGEASGGDMSGSGDISDPAFVSDLWQFLPNDTSLDQPTASQSGVANVAVCCSRCVSFSSICLLLLWLVPCCVSTFVV